MRYQCLSYAYTYKLIVYTTLFLDLKINVFTIQESSIFLTFKIRFNFIKKKKKCSPAPTADLYKKLTNKKETHAAALFDELKHHLVELVELRHPGSKDERKKKKFIIHQKRKLFSESNCSSTCATSSPTAGASPKRATTIKAEE